MKRRARRSSLIVAAIGAAGLSSPLPFANGLASTRSSAAPTTGTCNAAAFPGSQPITEHDKSVLRRQTGQTAPAEAAVGVPSACSCCHGFPQAFAMDPFPANGRRVNSGLVKLSCPHLVRAIDELEDEGGIGMMNDVVKDSEELQRSMVLTHEMHAKVRRNMLEVLDATMNDDAVDDHTTCSSHEGGAMENILRQKLGERGAEAFLSSGVAGASAGSTDDVKCLHAWLGDYLFRGAQVEEDEEEEDKNNFDARASMAMGRAVVQALKERGVDISGTEGCRSLCDPSSNAAPLPPKPRNKQRLKTGKEIARRKRRRKEDEEAQQGEA